MRGNINASLSSFEYIVSTKILEIQVVKAQTLGEAYCKVTSLQFAIVDTN